MKRLKTFEIVIIALLLAMCIEECVEVKPGVEVFVEKHLNIVE